MAVRSFGNSSLNCLTAEQLQALSDKGLDTKLIIDHSCTSPELNTCERDAQELVDTYPLYNPRGGIYTKWGEVDLNWKYFSDASDTRWNVAEFRDEYAYVPGDRVILTERSGLVVKLYESLSYVPSIPGTFNKSLWKEICSVSVSEPLGLPDITSLLEKYEYYNPSKTITSWSKFDSPWSQDLENDEWGSALINKDFIYRKKDIVLYDSSCSDHTCVFIAKSNIPVDLEFSPDLPPPREYWELLYCVPNGKDNTCGKELKCVNGKVVSLSSGDNDLICAPVESNTGVGPRQ